MDTTKWVGLAYAELGRGPEAFDCLGLFLALQRDFMGRDLPDPYCLMSEARGASLIDAERPRWVESGVADFGDAVLFRAGRAWHIGFALDAHRMLHIEDDIGSRIELFGTTRWGTRLEGIYRFADD
jgi:cell wall-associated NlpC family hydrolase